VTASARPATNGGRHAAATASCQFKLIRMPAPVTRASRLVTVPSRVELNRLMVVGASVKNSDSVRALCSRREKVSDSASHWTNRRWRRRRVSCSVT
jgi:hypothetical protein